MMLAEIVVSEFMDEGALRQAFAGRDILYDEKLVDDPDRLASALGDCRALIVRNRTEVRGELLAKAPLLTVVGRLGVGLDNIDLDACRARGVLVKPATGANDLAVVEYVISAALTLLRRVFEGREEVIAGRWPRMAMIGRELGGKRLGLVGLGAIARALGTRGAALGMEVAAYDPFVPEGDLAWQGVERLSLEELLERSDVVSLHTPLTPQTRGLIGEAALRRMRKEAVLVNAARGGVVDETALCAALLQGRLAGAALDVFETEPLDAVAGAKFRGVPNLILTPHIAGVTVESNVRVSTLVARAVREALEAAPAAT